MSALSMQYKGFRLLLEEESKKEMFIDHVMFHESMNSATLYLDNIRPYEASEAYMFAPLGYWKAVYQDELYPDDYPYDLMPGINSSTATIVIKTDVMDGEYDYFYYCSSEWRKLTIQIENHKIIKINHTDTSRFIDETLHTIQVTSGLLIDLDINSQFVSDVPTTITVRQNDANELPTDIIVKNYGMSDLTSDFIVTFVSEIPTTIFVNGHSDLPTNITVKIIREESIPSDLVVVQKAPSDLPTEITVKYTLENGIATDMFVYQASNLPTNILIQQNDKYDIPTKINIQRVDRSNLPTTIIIKQWGEDTPYIHADLIVVRHDVSDIPTNVYVIAHDNQDLETTLDVEDKHFDCLLPSSITVKNSDYSEIQCSLIVDKKSNATLSTISSLDNTYVHNSSDLATSINIKQKTRNELSTELYVSQFAKLESTADIISQAHNELPITFEIVGNEFNEISTSLIVNKQTTLNSITSFISKGQNDISTTLTIGNNVTSEIDTRLIVNTQGMLETLSNITTRHFITSSDLPTIMQVSHNEAYIVPTTIIVLSKKIAMEACVERFTQLGKSQIPTLISVKNNTFNDISTVMNVVSSTAKLTAITEFIHGNHSDLPTDISVIYERKSELPITMRVNPLGRMENTINIINNIYSDLETSLYITNNSDIETTLIVEKQIILEAESKLVPHQLIKRKVACAKDSYCYNFTRLTNYGQYQFMNIGFTSGNDILQSIVGFDFASLEIPKNNSAEYFDYQTIQKATINLYKVSSLNENAIIDVYSIDDNWYEKGINYTTCEKLNRHLLTSIPSTKVNGWVTIDITSDLQNFEQLPSTKRSYLIAVRQKQKTNTTISMATMQNSDSKLAPYANVTYYHTPPNANWKDIDTSLYVKPYDDLLTTLEVPEKTVKDISTTLTVKAQTVFDLNFSITVDVVSNIYNQDTPTELDVIGYPCDEKGIEVDVYINATPLKSQIETDLTVVRYPEKEAYVYIL